MNINLNNCFTKKVYAAVAIVFGVLLFTNIFMTAFSIHKTQKNIELVKKSNEFMRIVAKLADSYDDYLGSLYEGF